MEPALAVFAIRPSGSPEIEVADLAQPSSFIAGDKLGDLDVVQVERRVPALMKERRSKGVVWKSADRHPIHTANRESSSSSSGSGDGGSGGFGSGFGFVGSSDLFPKRWPIRDILKLLPHLCDIDQ